MVNALGLLAFPGLMTSQSAGALFAGLSSWHHVDRGHLAQEDAAPSTVERRYERSWVRAA